MTDYDATLTDMPPQRVGDRRGWLAWDGLLPDDLQRAEDATLAHDHASQHWLRHVRERPATAVERVLLEHLVYVLPAELTTCVEYRTPTLRRRTWPQLEGRAP